MKKIFKEYGGVIIVVIAIVALISLVSVLMKPGGVMEGAFGNVVQSFVDKSEKGINSSTTAENLFDGHTWTYNKHLDGDQIADGNGSVTDFIKVKPDTSYALQCSFETNANKGVRLAYFNENQESLYLGGQKEFSVNDTWIIDVPNNDEISFVRICFYRNNASEDEVIPIETKLYEVSALQSAGYGLAGKSVLSFGDSIPQLASISQRSYVYQIAKNNYMQLTNKAQGGAKIQVVEGAYSILEQVANANQSLNPDFILFNGWTNDISDIVNNPSSIGEISNGFDAELNTSTFCGGFESIIKTIKEKWPNAKIIYVTTHKNGGRDVTYQPQLVELTLQMCEKWNIHVADVYNNSGLNTFDDTQASLYTTDRTHPNTPGYEKFYVPIIETKMNELAN